MLIFMEGWTDNGIVLLARPHGENGAVLTLMTEGQGKHAGFLHGAGSSKNKIFSELGHHVHAHWQAKSDDQLGHFKLESIKNWSGHYIDERLKLMAVISACHLCERAIPERENHPQIFHGLLALFEALDSEIWAAAYIMWEIALLKELGFAIDLTRCASGNGDDHLLYVSPKSGRAVSKSAGALYKDKLLVMPEFLKSKYRDEELSATPEDIETGFALTGFFLENWVFAQHSHGVPDARLRLAEQFVKKNNQI
tara:strand:- start:470522 stop:471280 length:759 start_codon:yes stop_codon:yes gene_type:complete